MMPLVMANDKFERDLWHRGVEYVAGVDEVGRGCLAGPVWAGCVVFAPNTRIPDKVRIDDSKKLSPKVRELSCEWIKRTALGWGVGSASVATINRVGIVKATRIAIRRAIVNTRQSGTPIYYLLLDAFYVPFVVGVRVRKQKAIIGGDGKSISIAAASIVAKVERDNYMVQLADRYPHYGWEVNKGYGTPHHISAIKRYGLTRHHRKLFVRRLG